MKKAIPIGELGAALQKSIRTAGKGALYDDPGAAAVSDLPELPPYDVGIYGQVQFAFSAEALRAYAEEAVKQERERCADLCERLVRDGSDAGECADAIRATAADCPKAPRAPGAQDQWDELLDSIDDRATQDGNGPLSERCLADIRRSIEFYGASMKAAPQSPPKEPQDSPKVPQSLQAPALTNANRRTVLMHEDGKRKLRHPEISLVFNNDAELRQAYAELDALSDPPKEIL